MWPKRPEGRTCRSEPKKQQLPPLDRVTAPSGHQLAGSKGEEQKASASRMKLEEALHSRLDISSPSPIGFHSWFSCSEDPQSPGGSLGKKIPVP